MEGLSNLGGLTAQGGGGAKRGHFLRSQKNANQHPQIAHSAQRILISPEINPHFRNLTPFSRNSVDVQTQESRHAKSGKWHSHADLIVHTKGLDVFTGSISKQRAKATENIPCFSANSNETRNFVSYEEIREIIVRNSDLQMSASKVFEHNEIFKSGTSGHKYST